MKLFACAVKDTAIGAFQKPLFVTHTGLAVRAFADEVKRTAAPSENPLSEHAEDFELWCLGWFEDQDGTFHVEQERLIRGADVKGAM